MLQKSRISLLPLNVSETALYLLQSEVVEPCVCREDRTTPKFRWVGCLFRTLSLSRRSAELRWTSASHSLSPTSCLYHQNETFCGINSSTAVADTTPPARVTWPPQLQTVSGRLCVTMGRAWPPLLASLHRGGEGGGSGPGRGSFVSCRAGGGYA